MKKIENMSKTKVKELDKLLENFRNPHQFNVTKEDVIEHVSNLLSEAHESFVQYILQENR